MKGSAHRHSAARISLVHAAIPLFSREHNVPLSTQATSRIATAGAVSEMPGTLGVANEPQLQSAPRAKAAPSLLSDYMALFKVRVTALVVITAWAGFYLGSIRSAIPSLHIGLLETLAGIALISAGAAALNEALERKSDARMVRTAGRPLASGRIGLPHGLLLAFSAVVVGSLILLRFTNPVTVVLGLLTVFTYVAVYTPLKFRSTLATFIGAFPGAMGPLLGWTAARGRIEWPAVALFAILFVWQFPHFMAIAWLYREDYGRAGIRMLPVVQPDGWSTVVEALAYAIIMIPVSLLPWYFHTSGSIYAVAALILGIGYLAYTIRFAKILKAPSFAASRPYARTLLKASVLYLPLLLIIMMLDATAGRR
jgi:protoheme IX farnesyltransferase